MFISALFQKPTQPKKVELPDPWARREAKKEAKGAAIIQRWKDIEKLAKMIDDPTVSLEECNKEAAKFGVKLHPRPAEDKRKARFVSY